MDNKKKKKDEILTAGKYNLTMVEFLGDEIIRSVYDSSLLMIEDQQKFSNEVRTKGLQCSGLLVTIIVALITAIYTIESVTTRLILVLLAFVFAKGLLGIFKGIIIRKDNYSRGNTQSYLLSQDMIESLRKAKKRHRTSYFLASNLKGMERDARKQREQTNRMQRCFEQETKSIIYLVIGILLITSIVFLIHHSSLPLY